MNYTTTHYLPSTIAKMVILLLLIAFTPPTLAVKYHALLIGVSHYDNPSIQPLNGPKNDVELMQKVLLEKGFDKDNIHILADGVTIEQPTKDNIFTALTELIKTVEKEDFVYLHFSGHGSQQPEAKDSSRTEPEGRDEIFLPRDAGLWQDEINSVENAIVDDDINEYLNKLRQKGAFVWVVFDSCHSGTMTRAALAGVKDIRDRRVDPLDLGIPSEMFKTSQTQRQREETALDDIASNVAFYAVQPTEKTPEMPLPLDKPSQIYGLFTFTLAQVLTKYDNITYRQAAQLILNHYAAHNISQNKNITPLFEGDLNSAIFSGHGSSPARKQWLIEQENGKLKMNAGQLHQLAAGSILAVVQTPAPKAEVLGYVKITRADIFTSELESVKYNRKSAHYEIPRGAYARLVAPKINLALTVALPPNGETNETEARARQVLKDFVAKKHDTCIKPETGKQACVNIKWVEANSTFADLRLLFQSNKLWLLPPDAELITTGDNRTHSIDLYKSEADLRTALIDNFRGIAKVRNLLRLSTRLYESENNDNRLEVGLRINQGEGYKAFDMSKVPTLYEGTKMEMQVENNSITPIDVTILYVKSDYGIEPIFPIKLETNRIEASGHISDGQEMTLEKVSQTGMEYLIVISVQGKPERMATDFRFLSQDSIPLERKGADDEQMSLYDLFSEAVFGGDWIRSTLTRETSLKQTAMYVFPWKKALPGAVDVELDSLLEEGEQAYNTSDYSAALAKWQKGLKKAQENNYQRYLSKFLSKLGLVHRKLEQRKKALDSFQAALKIQREKPDKRGEAKSLINLGEIHFDLQHYEQASNFFEQTLNIGEIENDDKRRIVDNLIKLGDVYFDLGEYKKGRKYYRRAILR